MYFGAKYIGIKDSDPKRIIVKYIFVDIEIKINLIKFI